jgi:hypothetical protein
MAGFALNRCCCETTALDDTVLTPVRPFYLKTETRGMLIIRGIAAIIEGPDRPLSSEHSRSTGPLEPPAASFG